MERYLILSGIHDFVQQVARYDSKPYLNISLCVAQSLNYLIWAQDELSLQIIPSIIGKPIRTALVRGIIVKSVSFN